MIRLRMSVFAAMLAIILAACATSPPSTIENACKILEEKRSWARAADRAESRYGAPKAVMLAIVRQESAFEQSAKPPRRRILFVFPWFGRQSSAYGYAQATEPTWELYQKETGRPGARRGRFEDAIDFVGWYMRESKRRSGIEMADAYNQYLAYHEGWGGYNKGSFRGRKQRDLRSVATRVAMTADRYHGQLEGCAEKKERGRPTLRFR
ncbi:MAG: transglycosylase SLT domain-containing protein [Pseudomonadota bacterium]